MHATCSSGSSCHVCRGKANTRKSVCSGEKEREREGGWMGWGQSRPQKEMEIAGVISNQLSKPHAAPAPPAFYCTLKMRHVCSPVCLRLWSGQVQLGCPPALHSAVLIAPCSRSASFLAFSTVSFSTSSASFCSDCYSAS